MTTVAIKERPILFNGDMVRAILSGAKTQTRRVMKPQPTSQEFVCGVSWSLDFSDKGYGWPDKVNPTPMLKDRCPLGTVGDDLWVRETFAIDPNAHLKGHRKVLYKTDSIDPDYPVTWRPSIHMPRWASRITLEITGVRVERLQDISEEDAIAEGIETRDDTYRYRNYTLDGSWCINAKDSFFSLAKSCHINTDANPFVWVIEFERVQS